MKNVYKILAAFLLLGSYAKSQVTVTGGSTATYSTVNTAFAAINAGTHFGAITIDITASTTESTTPTPLNASGQGGANYTSIVLRPTVTATISGAMVTGRGVLELDGSDNVTIDGDISGGPVTRELTIVNNAANTVASTAVIRLIGRTTLGLGATNNTIKNCVIIGNTEGNDGISGSTVTSSHGIYAGNNAVALLVGSTTGADYDNNTIENNDIRKAYFAIYVGSATANTSGNLNIKNNIIGSNTVGETITAGGINLSGVVSATLSQNEVFNLTPNTSISPYGIQIAGAGSASVTISRNNVHGIKSLSISGWGAYGISISGGTDHLMVNNIVYDIMTVNYLSTSTLNAIGLRLASGTGHKIYYNSVNLYGAINLSTGTSTSVASAALFVTSAACTGLDIKNNIFCNIQTSTVTTQKFMAVWFPSTYDFANAVLNNNSYNVTNDGDHFVGKVGTTNGLNEASTLGAWQALSQVNNPTNDLNSIPASNMAAPFTSNTNLTIPPNTVYGAESGAVLIPSLGTNIDYNAAVRPLAGVNANLNPDMGAYEFDGIAGIPIDAGLQSLISPATTGCYTSAENVVVSIKNYGTSAISNIPVTVIVSGAVNQTYTATYIPIITAGATANFTVGVLNMLTSGTYSFNGSTSLAGDGNAINDALTTTIRTVIAPSTLPQFVNFTGFTGSNLPTFFPLWTEATGTAVPTGTTSTWTSQTNLNTTGNVNARVLLQTNTNDEWIVGPKFTATANSQVTFDAALTGNTTAPFTPDAMGSDDKVRVMVSTDCGASFTPVFTISATNSLTTSFTNFSVPLGAYAGQNIIVAFLAQDGPVDDIESYYFQLDNINLYNTSATDAGVSAFVAPGIGCYTSSEPLVVQVNNFGTAPISNFPVSVWVSGAIVQTLTATYTGTLAVAASANFTVGSVNMTTAGQYNFKGFTSLVGDLNAFNDTALIVRNVTATSTLPQFVDFTGFTGANLPTPFPLWTEATGTAVPTGTTSSWTTQANLNSVGNTNARVLLSTNTNDEWIVGPKFTATANSQVSFDASLTNNTTAPFTPDAMGSDDMVRVMVSTDCGVSFTPIFTISAANSLGTNFTNFTVPLGVYSGQSIIVGFLAQDGPIDDIESYYFQLDNINLYNASPTDAGVSAFVAPALGCYTNSEPVVVTVNNYGTAAISNFPVSVWVSGALTQTLTATYTGTIAVSASANFTLGSINMSAAGQYNFKGFTSLTGDLNLNNDTTTITRTALALGLLPQSVSFTGYTGANLPTFFPDWKEGTGATAPTGTTSSWTSQTNLNSTGNVNARVLLSAIAANEWIVGPKFTATAGSQISFDAGITNNTTAPFTPDAMGSDDRFRVMVSTDCGVSFTPIFTISATNSLSTTFTNFNVSLGAYSGQDIVVAFLAQDGPVDDIESYYFQLDNINLFNAGPIDAGILSLVAPTTNTCYGASEPVIVDIKNYGTAALSNIPVVVTISGPVNQTITSTYTGTIAAGATATFNVGSANMSIGGVYTFTSTTNVTLDPNAFNNLVVSTISVSPVIGITGNTSICSGASSTLTASGSATSYTWNTTANTQSIVVTPTVNTVYSLTASDGTCSTVMSTTITVTNPTITGIGSTVCNPNTGTLSVNAFSPSTVNWYSTLTSTTSLASGSTYTLNSPVTTTVFAEASSVSSGSLFTNVSGTSAFLGEMFDVVAINPIEVTGFDVHLAVGSGTIEVWYRPGTHVGFSTSNTGWTLASSTNLVSNGVGTVTPVTNTISIQIPAGQTYGFYIVANTGPNVRYSSGTAVGNIITQNADLQILEGTTGNAYFNATTVPRAFNGTVKYNKIGCTSPRIPVTLTVSPQPTVNVTSSASIICVGQTATLTASGGSTYLWNTSSTNTSIAVSPSVNTSYTVIGTTNGCSNMAIITQSVSTCTGIDANLAFSNLINVYPNPSSGVITADFNFEGEKEVVITNSVGQIITTLKTKNTSEVIDLNKYAKGIYFVKVISNTNSANYRIVIQ